MNLKDKFLGAILGCAVGDALGAPYEGRSATFMQKKRNLTSGYEKIPGYPLGQYTDDTQMTIALCESIISQKKVDGKDIANKFANLWSSNTIIGAGSSCNEAMMRIIVNGASWDNAGAQEGCAGNGSAMRASPIGLFDCNDFAALKRDAVTQSIITHKDKRATAGSIAVASAVFYCVNNETIDANGFIDFISKAIGDVSAEFAKAVEKLKELIHSDAKTAFTEIISYGQTDLKPAQEVTAFVIPTVLTAFYHFLKSPSDWSKSVEGALNFGGDCDTTASIVGAISGSCNGYKKIPATLIEDLKDYEYIFGIALKLYDSASGSGRSD